MAQTYYSRMAMAVSNQSNPYRPVMTGSYRGFGSYHRPKPSSSRPKPSSAPTKGEVWSSSESSSDWASASDCDLWSQWAWNSSWNWTEQWSQSETVETENQSYKEKVIEHTAPSDDYECDHADHPAMIKQTQAQAAQVTQEVLQRRGITGKVSDHSPVRRAGKSGRNRRNRNSNPWRGGKAVSRRAKAKARREERDSDVDVIDDDKSRSVLLDIRQLRYSQESCLDTFQDGRPVLQLVQELWEAKVDVSAPFLKLTVFESLGTFRCIDNRRLYALKEYGKLMGDDYLLMVHCNLYGHNTIKQVLRFMNNTDDTDGRDVRLRTTTGKKGVGFDLVRMQKEAIAKRYDSPEVAQVPCCRFLSFSRPKIRQKWSEWIKNWSLITDSHW